MVTGRPDLFRPAAPAPAELEAPPALEAAREATAATRVPRVRVRSAAWGAGVPSRLTAGWTTTPVPPDQFLRDELRTLRARSRDQVRKNDYARRFIQLLQSNVAGAAGIALESLVVDPDGTADTQARQGIERAWKRWGQINGDGTPDVTGTMSWLDLERLAIRTSATDGEFLLRYREGREAGPWAFQVQVLDPELLDPELNQDLGGGRAIRLGIEVDGWGMPIAYHLRGNPHGAPADAYRVFSGRSYLRVPADEILHAFVLEVVGQRRGIPWTATSLERLKMLGAYEEAVLTHARAGAMTLGFITRQPGATPFAGEEEGDNPGETILNMEAGDFQTLPVGSNVETYDPNYPNGELRPFVSSVLKGISAGLGPAYTSLAQDLEGTSYAGGRMGLLEERELYKYLQAWVAGAIHRRVFSRWLRWALLVGKVYHPATGAAFPSSRLDKFLDHGWRGRRWPWVDPRNDAQAAEAMVANGFTTESRVIRELGADPTEVWEERRIELAERQKRGITTRLDSTTGSSSPAPSEDPAPNPDQPLVGAGRR